MNKELIKKFEKILIPSIEKMIEKEKLHIQSLEFYQKKFIKLKDNKEFIKVAKLNLNHLKYRLKQYREFLEKLKNENI